MESQRNLTYENSGHRRRNENGQLPEKGLSEAGFVGDIAHDGLEGLHLAQEIEFDLIILDVMLPGLYFFPTI
jgi:DNA-binding response OmpR family regulator